MKNILVTGGAGYIGAHVCKALYKARYNPVVYDNLITGHRHAVKWGDFVKGDVLDTKRLAKTLKEKKIDAVVHMAAHIAAGESVTNPLKYYHNNTMGGLSLLEAMQEAGVKYLVFSSTAATYGEPSGAIKLNEKCPTNPINPYGASKLMMERMLADISVAKGFCSVSLRYFNAAGADPDSEIGCEHKFANNLIPILMEVQTGKRKKLDIYGTDYDTKDGTAVRDYIHVSDLASAHVLSLAYLFKGGKTTIMNLGTGKGHSVKEVVASVERVTGKKVPAHEANRRPGDPPYLVANASLAKKTLGWQPKFQKIDDIVRTAWEWENS